MLYAETRANALPAMPRVNPSPQAVSRFWRPGREIHESPLKLMKTMKASFQRSCGLSSVAATRRSPDITPGIRRIRSRVHTYCEDGAEAVLKTGTPASHELAIQPVRIQDIDDMAWSATVSLIWN